VSDAGRAGRESAARGGRTRSLREWSVAAAYGLLLVALAFLAPAFFRPDYLRGLLVAKSTVLIVAVGMTLVIVARQIDISVGSQFSVCGVIAGLLAKGGWPMPVVAAGTVACGALMGACNGGLVAVVGLPSIVVTLATMAIFRETLRWAREGEFVLGLPDDFQWFGLGQLTGQWTVILTAAAFFLVAAWCLRSLAGGRAVYAVGSDAEAARLAGMRPRLVVFSVFTAMGAITGLAALLGAIQFGVVDPNAGAGLELQVIAAAVVGGTAISGGRGTLFGTLVGVALLGTIGPALVFLNAEPQWEKAVQGLIILAAVATDAFEGRRR
jgi:rhamnose transport system permease protein